MSDLPKIKFSKLYEKMPLDANGRQVTLLHIHTLKLEQQEPAFINYDVTARDGSKYELPKKGIYLLLLFEFVDGGVFTTMRRWTSEKANYYISLKGKILEVVVDETE